MLSFPKETIEYALFEGVEQEGPNQRQQTLFIVGDVPISEIRYWLTNSLCSCLYFGAGGRFDYNAETIKELSHMSTQKYVTIESPIYNRELHQLSNGYWVIPYIWHGELIEVGLASIIISSKYPNVFGKIDTGNSVHIHALTSMINNQYAQGYSADKLLLHKLREKGKQCV